MSKHLNCHCSSNGWGVVLILIGLYYLSLNQGWIESGLPFWPVVAIIFGAYMLFRGLTRK
ncbi:hypothetical protein CL632_00045 [bacterium]|jgi:hypothetical protein|nr:hypothetical protein [bacterium]MDP6756277.1 DUF5668 domain-containing protein [Patescibacteria group bacterium]|tara:strand:+ start:1116 stop:1295 length:180 start_codon:yes stop_codon:yes gene_type:complete